ncbi:dolichol kinase-like isoform X1 [Sycon ciliatum]|uniref:dolichol kinase-like isoform X1 n=1 Tax=Sycon ciliatum TaxID=27933 RepID=UPI0031F699D1
MKQAARNWLQQSGSHNVEVRLASLSSLIAGFLLRNRMVTSVFLISVPIGTIVLSTFSEYFFHRWNKPFRSGSRGGLAVGCTLVPLLLVATCVCAESHNARNLDILYYYVCVASACSLMTMLSTVCLMAPPPNNYGIVVMASIVLSAIGWNFVPQLLPGYLWLLVPLWGYSAIVLLLLWALPNSFSAGEVAMVGQGIFLLFFDVSLQTLRQLHLMDVPKMFVYDRNLSSLAAEVMVTYSLMVGVVIVWPWTSALSSPWCLRHLQLLMSSHKRWSIVLMCWLAASIVFFLAPWMQLVMNVNIVLWTFRFLFSLTRAMLCGYWAICLVVAFFLVRQGFVQRKILLANRFQLMMSRKKFHFLAVAVFLPGLVLDQEFMIFASGIAIMLFVILEYIRSLRVWPIGTTLDQYLRPFVDSRDCGNAILTHIYLLVGFAVPCFAFPLSHFNSAPKLATYAGVLSLGFGDSAASLCGMRWGRLKWSKLHKTVEGSLAFLTAQLLACYAISLVDKSASTHFFGCWQCVVGALVAVAVMEAFTGHIDNLILPPYLYALLALSAKLDSAVRSLL